MPSWLQPIAEWNPVSTLTAAIRDFWGNPNPMSGSGIPAEHPVLVTIDLGHRHRCGLHATRRPQISVDQPLARSNIRFAALGRPYVACPNRNRQN